MAHVPLVCGQDHRLSCVFFDILMDDDISHPKSRKYTAQRQTVVTKQSSIAYTDSGTSVLEPVKLKPLT